MPPVVMPFFNIPSGGITPSWYKALILQLDPDDDEAEQKVRMEIERRAARDIRRSLRDMQDDLYPDGYEPTNADIESARVREAFRTGASRDALARALQDSTDLGVSVAVEQLNNVGYGFDWTLSNLNARDWALTYTDDVLAQLGTTSARTVGQAVGRWVTNGEPLPSLIRDLQPVFGRQRAELIASTEVTRAYAEGTHRAYVQAGIIQKMVWRTARDELVCPICAPLNDQVVDIRGSFFDKLPPEQQAKLSSRVSARFTLPPAHPRCRCWITASFEEVTVNG